MNFRIAVTTKDSEDNVKSLTQQIREFKGAVEKASQTGSLINIDGTQRSVSEVISIIDGLQGKLKVIDEQYLVQKNKVANEDIRIAEATERAKVNLAVRTGEQLDKIQRETLHQQSVNDKKATDEFLSNAQNNLAQVKAKIEANVQEMARQNIGNPALEKQQLAQASSVSRAQQQSMYNNLFGLQKYTELQTQIRQANVAAQEFYSTWKKTGDETAKLNFEKHRDQVKGLTTELDGFNKSMGISVEKTGYLGSLMQKLRSHANWIIAGGLLGGAMAIPVELFSQMAEIEKGMAGMIQVNKGLHDSQEALNTQTQQTINMASMYGEKIPDVIELTKLWGRAYKDLSIVNEFTRQSLILTVADNMNAMDATKGLEAAMFQYGIVAKNAAEATAYGSKVVDVYTNVAHNAQVSATDLAHGVEQSGSVAHMTGVDFEFLTAMIATGTRATAKSGTEIGTMIKSVLGSFRSDKAQTELAKLGISVKQVGADGTESFRKAQDVLLDLSLATQSTNKDVEKLFQSIAGGKWQFSKAGAMLGDYKTFIETWGLAVSSAGFSAGQIGVQIDTLSRRFQKLKTDMAGLSADTGNGGLLGTAKGILALIDNVVVGLSKFSTTQVTTTLGIYVLLKALSMGRQILIEYEGATTAAAAATTVFGKASAFLGKMNPFIAAMTILTGLILTYTDILGDEANADQRAAQASTDNLAAKEQMLNSYKQQSEFTESLISSYQKMDEQVNSGALTDEKAIVVKNNMKATLEQLTKTTGDDGIAQLVAAGNYKEASDAEKKAYDGKTTAINNDIAVIRANQLEYTRNQLQWTQDRIDALKSETTAWSLWAQICQKAMNVYAGFLDMKMGADKWIGEHAPMSTEDRAAWQQRIAQETEERERIRAWKPSGAIEEINSLQQQMPTLQLKYDQLSLPYVPVDYNVPGAGGNKVDDSGEPNKTPKGPNEPADATSALGLSADKLHLKNINDQSTEINNGYKESIDRITDAVNRYGASYEFLDDKIAAINKRTSEYKDNLVKLQKQMDDDLQSANQLASATGATITVTGNGDGSLEAQAMDYFVKAGYSPALAAGIVGNLMTESGLNPTASDGTGAYGIGQWMGGRLQGLYDFAAKNNSDYSDRTAQLAYVDYELHHGEKDATNSIVNSGSSTPEEYAYAVSRYYERPAEPANPERQSNARIANDAYFSGSGPQTVTVEGLGDTLASAGYTQDQWNAMSVDNKKQFIEDHKAEIKDAKELISYLEQLSKEQKSIADLKARIAAGDKDAYEAAEKGIKEVEEYQRKQAELTKRETLASYGINVTSAQKDNAELTNLEANVAIAQVGLGRAKEYNLGADAIREAALAVKEAQNARDKLQKQQIPEDAYAKAKSDIDYSKGIYEASEPRVPTISQNADIAAQEIKYAQENIDALYKKIMDLYELSGGIETDAIKKAKSALAQAWKDLDTLRTAYDEKLRESEYDLADDLLLKGNKIHSILKKLIDGIAEDALKAAMHVKNVNLSAGSILIGVGEPSKSSNFFGISSTLAALATKNTNGAQILNGASIGDLNKDKGSVTSTGNYDVASGELAKLAKLTDSIGNLSSKDTQNLVNGAGNGTKSTTGTGASTASSGTNILGLVGSVLSLFHANGGVVNTPSIAGEDGEEVIVPVEKNTGNSDNLLNYAAKKLGTSTAVTASVSPKTMETAQSVSTNREHLDKLDTQITLMQQQNTMLLHMINNGTGGSTAGIAQPIIVSNQQSDADLASQITKLQANRLLK
jgi:hypothetical protein